ncbi:MAG: NUDIX hydrolase [Cryobacterium sp.]|nr:NUDIX hydrolase [Cryobacterium sp.]
MTRNVAGHDELHGSEPRGERLRDRSERAQVLESEVVFDGAVWHVRRDRFRFGNDELVRDYVEHPGAVAVLAVDDDDRVVLITQYRHASGIWFWELPAGLRDVADEPLLDTAKRELAEEADLRASSWDSLIDYFPSTGGSSEHVAIFRASDIESTGETFDRQGEEAELEVHRVPFADVLEACRDGRMRDGLTVTAVLAEHARRTANGHGGR